MEHHPHSQAWRWKHYPLGVFFLLRVANNFPALMGQWTWPYTVNSWMTAFPQPEPYKLVIYSMTIIY